MLTPPCRVIYVLRYNSAKHVVIHCYQDVPADRSVHLPVSLVAAGAQDGAVTRHGPAHRRHQAAPHT